MLWSGLTLLWLVGAVFGFIWSGTSLSSHAAALRSALVQEVLLVESVRSGNWSDPQVWNTNQVPSATDKVVVAPGHAVVYDLENGRVSGVQVKQSGILQFHPGKTTTLETDANIVVEGTLVMRPASPYNVQTLRFINVDESKFVGSSDHALKSADHLGHISPAETDIGLWVIQSGQLDIQGSAKTAWTRLEGSAGQGAQEILLEFAPDGWQPGDEIAIAPTQSPELGSVAWGGYSETTIAQIDGNFVSLVNPTAYPHPKVNEKWTAEVMNLTRNVRIEGTLGGRAHTLIESKSVQNINYAQFRFMGPRHDATLTDSKGNDLSRKVMGRYAIHFHMMQDYSRGSLVEGTIVRDSGNHAFVPHASHGILLRGTIAHRTRELAYWWDLFKADGTSSTSFIDSSLTHDSIWEDCIASATHTTSNRTSAMIFLSGKNNVARNCVAVGAYGPGRDRGAFGWDVNNDRDAWTFEYNLAHNNQGSGLWSWSNSRRLHTIIGYEAYHNSTAGLEHGAYVNCFNFRDIELYGNLQTGLILHAQSLAEDKCNSSHLPADYPVQHRLLFTNLNIDQAGMSDYAISLTRHNNAGQAGNRVLVENCNLRGYNKAGIGWGVIKNGGNPENQDYVNCTFAGNAFYLDKIAETSLIRIQDSVHGALLLKRSDQPGDFVPDWNASVTAIEPFITVQETRDAFAPYVSIFAPANGANVSEGIVLAAVATDAFEVYKVEFFVGEELVGVATIAPFQHLWNTSTVADGTYQLTAKAYDGGGRSMVSKTNTVIVNNTNPVPNCTDIVHSPSTPVTDEHNHSGSDLPSMPEWDTEYVLSEEELQALLDEEAALEAEKLAQCLQQHGSEDENGEMVDPNPTTPAHEDPHHHPAPDDGTQATYGIHLPIVMTNPAQASGTGD